MLATRRAVGNRWRRHRVGADRHADVSWSCSAVPRPCDGASAHTRSSGTYASSTVKRPSRKKARCRYTEDHARGIEQNMGEVIDAEWLDLNLRDQIAALKEGLAELAQLRREHDATGYPLSDDALQGLRRMRQKLLDLKLPPEWVNAQPAFAGIGGDKERRSPGAQQRKSRGAQRRKRRRR